ncbi:Zeatin O-glucosyltransferase [Stylosanthes scabra]|uniref:Glycosyltransferase n=1 Tax=Stylosanthes scabra TaxID=79078 RepID=A0ABU6Z6K1_9FABA|nr:Zeatin O-glucosyltransferase [Stylosanthes scabra]
MASNGKSNNNTTQNKNQIVVVMVPFPAQGHLNQLLHLSRLILSHNIPVHYVGTKSHNLQATLRVQGWDPNSISTLNFHEFELPPYPSPPPNPNQGIMFPSHLIPSFYASSNLREPVASLIRSLLSTYERVVVIHDSLMASVAQDATEILNVENYTFQSVSAFTYALYFVLDDEGNNNFPNMESLRVSIPKEVPSLEGCLPEEIMDFVKEQTKFLALSNGFIHNTSRAIEGPYMEIMEKLTGNTNIKHFALGPFNPLFPNKKSCKEKSFIIEWLDRQEPNSVIYISFGTTTSLKEEQIKEIAIGLERSKKKFIWVLREADKGDIFGDGDGEVRRYTLPDGFEERIEGVGLVIRDWAPQLKILSHNSTGGFMSHCGWNSSMESITMGVPIAAWPMHSDQPRNMALITQVLKIGLVVRDWDKRDELVTASLVENAVTTLLASKEGDEMRERALKLRDAVLESMDEGGVSPKEMGSFIAHITR